jgi:non-haem Fe2+, alpha-ketoglutarate-dependent halogenase
MGKTLSAQQVASYERQGFYFPVPVLTDAETAGFRAALGSVEARLGAYPRPAVLRQPHLHFRWAWDLATRPAILDAVEDLIGPNILVHSVSVFAKRPHDPGFVSWHQDGHYWRLDEARLTSAWVALSPSNPDNGCMRVVPGSHRERLAHIAETADGDNLLSTGLTLAATVDEATAVDMALRPGEMSLHHVNVIHGSGANRSPVERVGVAVRYTAPEVRQATPHHAVVLARGRDEHHHFELLATPPGEDLEASFAALAAFTRRAEAAGRTVAG